MFAAGRRETRQKGKALTAHTTRFPAFGLQIHRHHPPTQEKIAIVVGNGNARTVRALAPLLEHGDFTATRSAREHRKIRLTGDTDVDVSIEAAVGTWVACDSADQALSFDCGRAYVCGEQDSSQHRGCLLRDRRTNDGFRVLIRNQVSSFLVGAAFLQGLTVLIDELPVKELRVSWMSRTIRPVLCRVSCSNQS